MAKVSAFGFSNTTDGTHTITPKALGLTTNYALTGEDANNAILNNKTAPIDAEEIVTFRSRSIASVNTDLNIQNPSKVKSGIQYQVQLEDVLVTTDSEDAAFRVDEPIVALLTIRHPRSGNITDAHVATVINRLISCLMKSDGTWRFADLMRGAERPIAD
jgi:hypothetical protein